MIHLHLDPCSGFSDKMQYVLSEGIIILCQQYQGLTGVLSVEKLTKNDDDPGLGYCYGDTEEVTLELLDYDEVPCHEDWIEIVAHELIHVKQHLLGELVDLSLIHISEPTRPY